MYLELIPNAVIKASFMPYMKGKGLALRTAKKISGRMMKAWIDNPANTVAMNRASLRISPPMSTILATRWEIRLQTPIGAYLNQNKLKKGKQNTKIRTKQIENYWSLHLYAA